jgi:hypothetical protein
VYIPLARFGFNTTAANISGIYFSPDTANNYFPYLNNIYFASVNATYPSGREEGREERERENFPSV